MNIRLRLSLWYAGIMFVALMAMGVLLFNHLVLEPHREALRNHISLQQASDDPDIFEDVVAIVVWCGVPAALFAMAGGWWLVRKSLAPVTLLADAMERITEHNLNERLTTTSSGDELERLTHVFNAMLTRLDDSFHRIREFTLHASHELKTPLTILCGETETALRDETLSPAERERFASQLEELHRLARIVDNLTLLTKADAGQVELKQEPIQFDELIREAYIDSQILAESQKIQVKLLDCEPVVVVGDRHRLRQLLLNLADNAIKYNQPAGKVTFSLRRNHDMAEFKITNNGAGIPPESLPRVFDRFYRVDPARSSEVEGCGLGLSIAKWIVETHRGTIQIESIPSSLTTIIVKLPLKNSIK